MRGNIMHFFTSATTNYIPKARVLAKTLKIHNPDCYFSLGLSDNLPQGFDINTEPFDEVIFTDELAQIENKKVFFFKHNVTEICTAVKPALALDIINRHKAEKVIYLDPDIAVFSSFNELSDLLNEYSMIFTPHQTIPEKDNRFIVGNEILFLKKGIYNLGFFAVKADKTGVDFLNWWHKRLTYFCMDDDYTMIDVLYPQGLLGLFTDQKWIDMVPAFFDNYYILKNPGYNVSTWNLTRHTLTQNGNGNYTVDNVPLIFMHFSGYDSRSHHIVLDQVIQYNPFCADAKELSEWYGKAVEKEGQNEIGNFEWKYSRYSNGEVIPKNHRKILNIRVDAHSSFPDPFYVNDGFCFYNWAIGEYGKYMLQPINNEIPKKPKNYKLKIIAHSIVNNLFPYNTRRRNFIHLVKNTFMK